MRAALNVHSAIVHVPLARCGDLRKYNCSSSNHYYNNYVSKKYKKVKVGGAEMKLLTLQKH